MENNRYNDLHECPCRRKLGGELIQCFGVECDGQWHHLECTKLKEDPKGLWKCPKCKRIERRQNEEKKRREKYDLNGSIDVETVENIIVEAEIDVENVPTAEITQHDIANAEQKEAELRKTLFNGARITLNEIHTIEHWLKLGRSDIHARGVYAIRDIRKSVVLIEYSGELIPKSEVEAREKQYLYEGITAIYFFDGKDGSDTVIDATKSGSIARFVNHSCSGNVYSKVINGKLYYITKYPIFAGDEITINYHINFEPKKPRIPCKCRKERCHGFLDYY